MPDTNNRLGQNSNRDTKREPAAQVPQICGTTTGKKKQDNGSGWIRNHLRKLDPDPHWNEKLDTDPHYRDCLTRWIWFLMTCMICSRPKQGTRPVFKFFRSSNDFVFLVFIFLNFKVHYSTLLHLPPLRFHCVRGRGMEPRAGTVATLASTVRCSKTQLRRYPPPFKLVQMSSTEGSEEKTKAFPEELSLKQKYQDGFPISGQEVLDTFLLHPKSGSQSGLLQPIGEEERRGGDIHSLQPVRWEMVGGKTSGTRSWDRSHASEQKNLWGLGTQQEYGCGTGRRGYLGWQNRFLGINSWAP